MSKIFIGGYFLIVIFIIVLGYNKILQLTMFNKTTNVLPHSVGR